MFFYHIIFSKLILRLLHSVEFVAAYPHFELHGYRKLHLRVLNLVREWMDYMKCKQKFQALPVKVF
ncbi:hypothetical protein AAULH_03733 [Lactobacillus helveticus MTCC 5463]|nr:hypothetical protein AAULH_03733 [Lactobacillus helveticus MTCC 5463]